MLSQNLDNVEPPSGTSERFLTSGGGYRTVCPSSWIEAGAASTKRRRTVPHRGLFGAHPFGRRCRLPFQRKLSVCAVDAPPRQVAFGRSAGKITPPSGEFQPTPSSEPARNVSRPPRYFRQILPSFGVLNIRASIRIPVAAMPCGITSCRDRDADRCPFSRPAARIFGSDGRRSELAPSCPKDPFACSTR